MSSFKRLNKADVTTTLYAANRLWNIAYTNVTLNQNAFYYTGSNVTFSINETQNNGQYPSLIYDFINHLFYQSYTGSLNTGSLMFNTNTLESASQQRPTSSYFNYNSNPLLIKQFPSGAGQSIGVGVINQDLYGSKILPNSFQISASSLNSGVPDILIKDDGYGNLYDVAQAQSLPIALNYVTLDYFENNGVIGSGIYFVGNIFYAHGIAVITNPDYQRVLSINSCNTYTITPSVPSNISYTDCLGFSRTISQLSTALSICATSLPIVGSGTATISTGVLCNPPRTYTFQNEHRIYENEVRCIVKESDFNLSYNPSLLKYGGQTIVPISGSASNGYTTTGSFDNSTVKDFATASFFQPYATTIGLYNDNNDLLMVAKLAKPIVLSPDTDMTFIVKYDL